MTQAFLYLNRKKSLVLKNPSHVSSFNPFLQIISAFQYNHLSSICHSIHLSCSMDISKSKSKITDLHEASFSSYLTQEDNFLHKLTTHPSISAPMKSEGTKIEGDQEGEIRVFAAEKYFNMNLEHDGPRIIDTLKSGSHHEIGIQRLRPMSRLGTPSVCSEASSNSQTALLSNPARNSSQTRHQKGNERWFFSGFACNGSCSDKKSVFVETNVAHRVLPGKEFRKEPVVVSHSPVLLEGRKLQARSRIQAKEGFRSPSVDIGAKKEGYLVSPTVSVNSVVQGLRAQREDQNVGNIEDDPRKSLEVFGSHLIKKEDIALNLQRKLSVLTWDAIPKTPTNLSTTSASSQVFEEDAASDASSDLFEIENISTSTQPVMFSKQRSDNNISAYAPSESSIEWSVVTASAADFSAASDYGEKMEAENRTHPGLAAQTRRSRPNSLLGCKSLKAVDVAETTTYKKHDRVVKSHLQQEHRIRPDIPRPIRKLPVEIKVKDFDFP